MSTPIQEQQNIKPVLWRQRASIWLGLGINPATLSVGGGLATQLSFAELLWVLPIGTLLLTLLTTCQGLIGRRRRQRLSQIASTTFGNPWGAGLINLLIAVGMIGWGGFQGGVSGASAAELFQLPAWAGALIMVIVLYTMGEFGINRWAALAWVTTGSAIALTLFTLTAIDLTPTKVVMPSPSVLTAMTLWLWAFGTVISYATLFSLRNPDFTWDLESDAGVVKANLFLFFPLLFSTIAGALLYRATGNWNIADVLTLAQQPALGHIFLMVSVISPMVSGWYSGGLALSNLTSLTTRQSTILICTLSFFLAATRFDQQLLPFLGILGAAVSPALVTILMSSVFTTKLSTNKTFAAWLAGAAVASVFQMQGMPTHIFAGAVTSILALLLFQAALDNRPAGMSQ